MKNIVVGADIGGSHIKAALIDLDSRKILPGTENRGYVNSSGSAEEIIDAWSSIILESLKGFPGCKKVGMAMPGPFDYENGISYIKDLDKYEALYRLNVKLLLADKIGVCTKDILLENDAACFLRGEVFAGAATESKATLGLTLGTGFGSALSIDGTVRDAELWQRPFSDSIAEYNFATRWFVKRYREVSGESVDNVRELSLKVGSSSEAKQVFLEFSRNLAVFLRDNLHDIPLDLFIIGGNITGASEHFLDELRFRLTEIGVNLPIRISELMEDAALIGAASLWNQHLLVETTPLVP